MSILTSSVRKLALTAHVTSSVGWLGAVGVFLALAIVGLTSGDRERVGAVYLSMELTTWVVIVPLCFAALLSGVVQGLGTRWGLLRHYCLGPDELRQLRIQLVADAGAALLALLLATLLSVFKPWGTTAYAVRGALTGAAADVPARRSWAPLWIVAALVAAALFFGLHLATGGVSHR